MTLKGGCEVSTIAKPPGRVLISAEQFGRMQAAGVFEGQHVELLDGELYEVTKNPPHNYAVDVPGRGPATRSCRADVLPGP